VLGAAALGRQRFPSRKDDNRGLKPLPPIHCLLGGDVSSRFDQALISLLNWRRQNAHIFDLAHVGSSPPDDHAPWSCQKGRRPVIRILPKVANTNP